MFCVDASCYEQSVVTGFGIVIFYNSVVVQLTSYRFYTPHRSSLEDEVMAILRG